jgi:hypothetical protein
MGMPRFQFTLRDLFWMTTLIAFGVGGLVIFCRLDASIKFKAIPLLLVSVLGMIWLWRDTHDSGKIAALSTSIFWLVLPSLVLFVVLPVLLKRGVTFWPSLGISVAAMLASYGVMVLVLKKTGVQL